MIVRSTVDFLFDCPAEDVKLSKTGKACFLALWFLTQLQSLTVAMPAVEKTVVTGETGNLIIQVFDADKNRSPCRIHLVDGDNQPVKPKDLPFWHDHFVCDGKVSLTLATGTYHWAIERGPEFERKAGKILIRSGDQNLTVTLTRIANLAKENWIAADLHVHRNPKDIRLLMRAEDLSFAPVVTWWNRPDPSPKRLERTVFRFDGNRIYTNMAGEDEREGGALLFFGLNRPLDLTVKSREYPSPMEFVQQARDINPDVWIDIEKPFWWDLPAWLASGEMKSIGIANNHMCRNEVLGNEAWGKPRDIQKYPGVLGNGFWSQEIYYHILNCGIRIPPSAGSASGVLPNPVGYNRVYAYCNQDWTRKSWFQSLEKGQVFVSNGPLIRATLNQQLPGSVIELQDRPLELQFAVDLTSWDTIPKLEVIHNGKNLKTVTCSKKHNQHFDFSVAIDTPGWILIRAIADNEKTFRFGSTAPWYIHSKSRVSSLSPNGYISKKSAEFFLNWTRERIKRVKSAVKDPVQLSQIIKHHDRALTYWEQRVRLASHE